MKTAALTLVLLFAVACAQESGGHEHEGNGRQDMMGSTAAFGEAGDAGDADRTVRVETLDALEFDPDTFSVEVGETVTFEVTNDGSTAHEFVLGDEAYQESHGEAMAAMEHSDGNGVFLKPGDPGTVTWTFTEAGEVLYACHVNGHFKAGMFGRIKVR